MRKISKSDQDPNQIDKDRKGLAALLATESSHFKVGTWVICNKMRGQVQNDSDGLLTVAWEDGSVSIVESPRR